MESHLKNAAAPAPSSLAGGISRKQVLTIVRQFASPSWCSVDRLVDTLLAALSPEAPAREPDGMTEDERRRWLAGRSDWREDEWQDHCGRQGCEECRGEIPMTRPRALTPRHEVPADDEMFGVTGACGEVEALACALFAHRCPGIVMHDDDLDHYRDAATRAFAALDGREAPAEGAGEAMDAGFEAWLNERNLLPNGAGDWPSIVAMLNHHEDALRARSSAPEAREEALGNLLAVIHGDGGHRALEVGTKQAALEAEKIVANLLSSAPEAREGEAWRVERTEYAVKFWVGVQGFTVATRGDDPDGGEHLRLMEKMLRKALGRISAAPSADKLREVVEGFVSDLTGGHPKARASRLVISHDALSKRIDQALAALKAEGGK